VSAPRHRIRRQVLEVTLQHQGAAWPLQSELSRIQSQSLEAIIDGCCTEAGDPDRLHRIESLEVDLGQVDLDNLEGDLVEKLGPRLREALEARIRQEDAATTLQGGDPETSSRLELVAFFAQTGHLPWWADASRPRLLDETLGLLLQRAARPLAALVQTLVRTPGHTRGELRRIVLHGDDERLSGLFAALVASAPPGLAQRPVELAALLGASVADFGALGALGITPARFRNAVWLAVLRAACIEESGSGSGDPVSFWREALAHVALELSVTYTSLVTALHENRRSSRSGQPDPLGAIVQSLVREIRGEAPATDSTSRGEQAAAEAEAEAAAASLPAEVLGEARRLLREVLEKATGARPEDRHAPEKAASARPEDKRISDPGAGESGEDESGEGESDESGESKSGESAEREPGEGEPGESGEEEPQDESDIPGDGADIPGDGADIPGDGADIPGDGSVEEMAAILNRLERARIPPRALFAQLRSRVRRVPARRAGPVLEASRDLDQQASTHGPNAPETATAFLRWLRQVIASRWLPPRVLQRGIEELKELEEAAAASLPAGLLFDAQRLLRETIEETIGARPEDKRALARAASARPAEKQSPDLPAIESAEGDPEKDQEPDTDSDVPPSGNHSLPSGSPGEAGSAEEMAAILDRLQRSKLQPPALFAALRAMTGRLSTRHAAGPGPVLEALRDLDRQALEHGPGAPDTASSLLRLLRRLIASRWLPTRVLRHSLEELDEAAAATLPAEVLSDAQRLLRRAQPEAMSEAATRTPRLDLAYASSAEAYVENAGLVILWPFLGHLFDRLELMADKQFRHPAALHRAVGLLQHLATEDLSPPEYQISLAKVLCGMPMTEVFDFGPPVTEAEAEEGSNLLTAVIANAPILNEMSIAGFRGSFLLRKGVLGTRDGAWLLRVERASYDVVLDRFPWGMSWVKLPWMEAPLEVEW
jgi:hypothetical protein